MVLPVAQYYSDGTVVNWTEPTVPGKAEPKHPAPVFTVTAATEATAAPAAGTQASGTSTPVSTTTTDNTARVLGGVALLVAVVAGGLVLFRRRPNADVK
jgi:periplasmic copper chaperone A